MGRRSVKISASANVDNSSQKEKIFSFFLQNTKNFGSSTSPGMDAASTFCTAGAES